MLMPEINAWITLYSAYVRKSIWRRVVWNGKSNQDTILTI